MQLKPVDTTRYKPNQTNKQKTTHNPTQPTKKNPPNFSLSLRCELNLCLFSCFITKGCFCNPCVDILHIYVIPFMSNPCVFCKVWHTFFFFFQSKAITAQTFLCCEMTPSQPKPPSKNPCLHLVLRDLASCGWGWERATCLPLSKEMCNWGCQEYHQNIAEVVQCPSTGFPCKHIPVIASLQRFHLFFSSLAWYVLTESWSPYSSDKSSCLGWRFVILEGLFKIYTGNFSYSKVLMMYKLPDSVQDNWLSCCSLLYLWSKYVIKGELLAWECINTTDISWSNDTASICLST